MAYKTLEHLTEEKKLEALLLLRDVYFALNLERKAPMPEDLKSASKEDLFKISDERAKRLLILAGEFTGWTALKKEKEVTQRFGFTTPVLNQFKDWLAFSEKYQAVLSEMERKGGTDIVAFYESKKAEKAELASVPKREVREPSASVVPQVRTVPPILVTTVARYESDEAALDHIVALAKKAKGFTIRKSKVEEESNMRIVSFDLGAGKKLEFKIDGFPPEVKDKAEAVRLLALAFKEDYEKTEEGMIVKSVWIINKNKETEVYSGNYALAIRNDAGITNMVKVALATDYLLDNDAQKFYAKSKNVGVAKTIAVSVLGEKNYQLSADRGLNAYLVTLTFQALMEMSPQDQDGLAGRKTLRKMKENLES